MRTFACLVFLLFVGCSTVVEYSEDKPREACYRKHAGAPFEIVKIVAYDAGTKEYLVRFVERTGSMYENPLNVPERKVGFECVNKKTQFATDASYGRIPQ